MSNAGQSRSHSLALYEGEAELKVRTWVQLARTFLLIQRQAVVAVAEHELTLPQFDVLATLRFSEGVSQQELAERLLVTKGNVCGVIDRLEKTGWMERRNDPRDRRTNRLYLTPEGKRKIDRVLADHDRRVEQVMRGLTVTDTIALRSLLETLQKSVESE